MIKAIHHGGFWVSDIDAILPFYRDVLGMNVILDATMDAPFVATLTGVPNSTVRAVILQKDDRGWEFLQLVAPPAEPLPPDSHYAHTGRGHLGVVRWPEDNHRRGFPVARMDRDLVLAANRDEYLDRAAEKPTLRRSGNRTVLAPRDLQAGGTWLGLNDAKLFAALTNRPCKALFIMVPGTSILLISFVPSQIRLILESR